MGCGILGAGRKQTEVKRIRVSEWWIEEMVEAKRIQDEDEGLRMYKVRPETPNSLPKKTQTTGELISTKPGVGGVDFCVHSHTLRKGNV